MTHACTPELKALARELAADTDAWAPHVRHDPAERQFHLLHEDAVSTVWLVCWLPGQDTGFHDHDGSAGAVQVVRGCVREDRLTIGGAPRSRLAHEGDLLCFGGVDIHRVVGAGDGPAVTVHAYAPRLRGMGAYEVDRHGVLRRHWIAEDVGLAPVAAA